MLSKSIRTGTGIRNIGIRIYRIIILSLVLYGCETWSVALRKEHRLKVFEKRVPRRMFGPKGVKLQEVEGNCLIMRSNLYSSSSTS
jgi:hypothetical protein